MRAALLAVLLGLSARAQTSGDIDGDTISAHDGRGNVSAVYNQFDGRNHSIVVSRTGAGGGQQWSIQHYDGHQEKAYSAVMDSESALYIVGMRRWNNRRGFLTIKLDQWGRLEWEQMDDWSSCSAVTVATDGENNVHVAGVCNANDAYPARVVKYSPQGSQLWAHNYDGGGRNYVKSLQVDFRGDLNMVVESVQGGYAQGAYTIRTVVLDKWGRQLEVR